MALEVRGILSGFSFTEILFGILSLERGQGRVSPNFSRISNGDVFRTPHSKIAKISRAITSCRVLGNPIRNVPPTVAQ